MTAQSLKPTLPQVILLLLITALALPGFAQDAAKPAAPKTPTTKSKKPPTPKVKQEPAKPVARKPLAMDAVAAMLTTGAADDTDCATILSQSEFLFEPEEEWMESLMKTKARAERPACYKALESKIPPAPALADVEREAPQILDGLKALVTAGKKDDIAQQVRPEFAKDMAQLFHMFDPSRYQKHQFGKFIAVPGRKVGVPVFVLPSDAVERFYFVVFSTSRGKLAVRDVQTGPAVADIALFNEKKWAVEKLRDLFRDLNQNSEATAQAISTPKLFEDMKNIAGWLRLRRGARLNVEGIQITPSVPLDQKSVRVVARVAYPVPSGTMAVDIDFERMGNELRVVRVRDSQGKDIAVDKDMDCYLLKRYESTNPCQEYKTNYTDHPWFLSKARLVYLARFAVEDGRADDIAKFADELGVSFPTDDVKGLPEGLRASALFLKGDYVNTVQVGAEAIAKGGEVYFPMMRRYIVDTQPLKKMILGVSAKGLRYIPSHEDRADAEFLIELAHVDKFKMHKSRPFIEVDMDEKSQQKDKKWDLLPFGSYCGAPNTPPQPGFVNVSGGFIKLFPVCPTDSRDPRVKDPLYVPAKWTDVLKTIERGYEAIRTGAPASKPQAPPR